MARYESLVKINGSIDDLVFYQLNGVNVVRKKSGFNTSDFKDKDSYKKVRENSSEFGHCSKTGKMIREALSEYLKDSGDKYLYQKFAKVMTEIKDLDTTSDRGKRTVQKGLETSEGKNLLRKFIFGNYENVQNDLVKNEDLFGSSVQKVSKSSTDETELVILKPNFETYSAEIKTQKLNLKNKGDIHELETLFDGESPLLYFAVLKNNGKIQKLGFL